VKNIIGAKQGPAAARNPAGPETPGEAGAPHSAIRFLTVDAESAGQRLDNFLFRHLKGVPKTHVYRIIRSGEVRINKGRVQAETRIEAGDVLRLPPIRISQRAEEGAAPPAPAREFPVLLEDESVLAVDKPAGTAVHGGSGVSFGVIEQLRTARPGAKFLELVHRLDRETSGILLVAKKRSALVALQDQFRERETGKTYLALVEGAWPANKKVLDAPLARFLLPDGSAGAGERRVRVVAKDHPDAMRAVTLVRVLAKFSLPGDAAPMSLLAVTIKTGRTHQIRVHLASAGHPIAGDDKYGESDRQRALQKLGLRRMFLHAWRLQFNHPASGERVALQAGLPTELLSLMPPAALEAMAQHPTPTAHD
jgi:23S rRNA pseudouridine955/2504/2580 synthase